jgi:hypothetical protein
VSDAPPDIPEDEADIEIAAGLRAGKARWQRPGDTRTAVSGAAETEELSERSPAEPVPGRTYTDVRRSWRLRARLLGAIRPERR